MQVLKILPPAQTEKTVKISTAKRPATGCQNGIVTGVDNLSNIINGVKGGNKDSPVEKLLKGSWITGIIINSGRITGSIAGKALVCQ